MVRSRSDNGSAAASGTARRVILVVEDHEPLRAAFARMLTRLGYEAISAPDAFEAIPLILDANVLIDLAIVDMVLPDPGSPAVLDALQSRMVPLRLILTSGYDPEDLGLLSTFQALTGVRDFRFPAKPCGYQELAATVAELLEAPEDRVEVITTGEWRVPE